MWIIEFIKNLICKEELNELDRWRSQWTEHRRWFASYSNIAMVLDNIEQNVNTTRANGTRHKSITDVRNDVDRITGIKGISGFAIVKNAKGDTWKGHYDTDPKLGVNPSMDPHSLFTDVCKYWNIRDALIDLAARDERNPELNYEICPIYNN